LTINVAPQKKSTAPFWYHPRDLSGNAASERKDVKDVSRFTVPYLERFALELQKGYHIVE
jgi:hypothetical protein